MHHLVLSCAKDVMPNESAVAVHYLHVADRWACGDGLAARDSAVVIVVAHPSRHQLPSPLRPLLKSPSLHVVPRLDGIGNSVSETVVSVWGLIDAPCARCDGSAAA